VLVYYFHTTPKVHHSPESRRFPKTIVTTGKLQFQQLAQGPGVFQFTMAEITELLPTVAIMSLRLKGMKCSSGSSVMWQGYPLTQEH
jgi:hypothetical protein